MPAPRFSNFKPRRVRTASNPVIGADRAGVHEDLAAMLDPLAERAADVSVERPAAMIHALRYAGAGEGAAPGRALGVKSHALYEFLMASARLELTERADFMVPVSSAMAFLRVRSTNRIREYVKEIANTWVSYDFTVGDGVEPSGRRMQLLQCCEVVAVSAQRFIRYTIPDDVRQVILAAKAYTWLELAAFAKFTCKYAARLYPILALRAGMSFEKPHPISISPEELAGRLGWPFRLRAFETRCLLPALADIDLHVRRFKVLGYEKRQADTRGRPVARILLTVSKAERPLAERRKVDVARDQVAILRALMGQRGIDADRELPAIDTLARAATALNTGVIETAKRWADTLDRARDYPKLAVGRNALIAGHALLSALANRGVGPAFELWMKDPDEPAVFSGRLSLRDLPSIDPDYVEPDDETPSTQTLQDYVNALLDPA